MSSDIKCWRFFNCREKNCPVYVSRISCCWLIDGTRCRGEFQENLLSKMEMCLECEVFKENMSPEAMERTCAEISRQFTKSRQALIKRDRDLESLSLEMAFGVSETLDALKKISMGDPKVRVDEASPLEPIAKLKQFVNETAASIEEMVDLSHEFAIGLAEHFDVLHRVSSGDLSARITGSSQIELLEALKRITNQTIESIRKEIFYREAAQNELAASEEKFRTFAENAPIGITIMNPDLTFAYINPTFTDIFGYSARDIPDKNTWFEKAYPDPEYRKNVTEIWGKELVEFPTFGKITPRTWKVRCKNGEDKIINFRSLVHKNRHHFVTYSDVTEHSKAQEKIRRSEERYRVLVDNIQDGVFIVQKEHFLFVNDALAKMLGYTVKELTGLHFYKVVAPEDHDMVMQRYQERQAGRHVPKEYELRLLQKNGKTRVVVNMTVDVLMFKGAVASIGTAKNITEKKLIDEQKKELEARLQRLEKMEAIGALAGGVAHDLNNILSGIVTYPELLLMNLDPDSPMAKSIGIIKKSGEKASAIVQDLLTLARRGVATMEVLDLNSLINEYLKSPEHETLTSFHPNIRLETDLAPDLLHIKGSSVHLSKTVMNLVSNAAEALPEGGRVAIATENVYINRRLKKNGVMQEGDYVKLSVSDSGVGISPEDMEKIFEPFYSKKVMGRSGTGLGMAVVWGTVKDHKGHIDVKSKKDGGTVFTLYFPATRQRLDRPGRRTGLEELWGTGQTVLVVDDMEEQRTIATAILSRLNYRAKAVSSGEEALSYVRDHLVDAVVLDMIMDPGMDGLETYENLVRIKPGIRVIIASGFSETERVKKAQALGAGEYVKKPYTIEKIGVALKKIVQ